MSGERNDGLAYQALDYIREHPEEWDQRHYFCRTTACFAGRALIIDAENHGLYGQEWCLTYEPGRAAAYALGWSLKDAATVFYSMTQDFSELERLVKNVLNGEVQDCDTFCLPL